MHMCGCKNCQYSIKVIKVGRFLTQNHVFYCVDVFLYVLLFSIVGDVLTHLFCHVSYMLLMVMIRE
jgi:hypothetical protein